MSRANISFVATSSRNVPVSIPAACALRSYTRALSPRRSRVRARNVMSRVAYAKSFCPINTLIVVRDCRKHGEMTRAVIVKKRSLAEC